MTVRNVAIALFGAFVSSQQVAGQGLTHAANERPSLRAFESDSEVAAYMRHVDSVTMAAHARDDSLEVQTCGRLLHVVRIARRTPTRDLVIHVTVKNVSGLPIGGAAIYFENSLVDTVDHDKGELTFTVPADRVPGLHPATLIARSFKWKDARNTVLISPGDSLEVEATLCGWPPYLSQIVHTSQGVRPSASRDTSDTSTDSASEAGHEGDALALAGRYLIVLRHSRLFTVDIGRPHESNHRFRIHNAIDAPTLGCPDLELCYNRLVVYGSRIVLIGNEGALFSLFRLDGHGELHCEGSFQRRPSLYDSNGAKTPRLVGDKLVIYEAAFVNDDVFHSLPALQPTGAEEREKHFHSIANSDRIFRSPSDSLLGSTAGLLGLTICDLRAVIFTCEASVVVGSTPPRAKYLSSTALYVWDTRAITPRDTSFVDASESILFRFPYDGSAPRAIRVSGRPVDDASFEESADGYLYVFVRPLGDRKGIWHGARSTSAALLRIALSEFGDGTRSAAPAQYHLLPMDDNQGVRNRFVGDWLLYGGGSGFGSANTSAMLLAAHLDDGEPVRIMIPHGIERIDEIGSAALLAGSDGQGLHFSRIDLAGSPVRSQDFELPQAGKGVLCTDGFFYHPITDSSGVIGVPVRGTGSAVRLHFLKKRAGVHFLLNAQHRISVLGTLSTHGVPAELSRALAVYPYCDELDNTPAPVFARGRVFVLLANELIEARLKGDRLLEIRRANLATFTRATLHE